MVLKTSGDVHGKINNHSFKNEINKVWDDLTFTLADLSGHELYDWSGHSSWEKKISICASRLARDFNVSCLYTFGAPRDGDKRWVRNLNIPHYRVVIIMTVVCSSGSWVTGHHDYAL